MNEWGFHCCRKSVFGNTAIGADRRRGEQSRDESDGFEVREQRVCAEV